MSKSKVFIADARDAAERIWCILQPAVERLEIAGSIRRRASHVGDIEIVCQPKILTDAKSGNISAIDELLEEIIPREQGKLGFGGPAPNHGLRWNTANPANGTRYKRLTFPIAVTPERICVDLFCVLPPASWGAILAIRTGPAEFSHALVTKRRHGGAMPDNFSQTNGSLFIDSERLETPEEADYFAALGMPYWPPEERTAERLKEFLTANAG